jgi:glycosyltransferase involved in cell wall biosynthesis
MNVAILVPTRSGGSGGLIKHLKEVVPRMSKNTVADRISVFVPKNIFGGLQLPGAQIRTVSENDFKTGFREMGRLVDADPFDAVLITTPRPVPVRRHPCVYMVQNIEPIQRPSYTMPLAWRLRLWLLRQEIGISLKRATCVIALSNNLKSELSKRYQIKPDNIHVVYHGFDPCETGSSSRPVIDMPDRGFLFSAGSIVPYRGYEDIIRASAVLVSSGVKIPTVILAGHGVDDSNSYFRSLVKLARALNVEAKILWPGFLSRREMTWCYQHARMFIETSRAEAFPNILVEAIGNGCVCVSCDHPPMPEVFGDSALYYPTGDKVALARRIREVMEANEDVTEEWSRKTKLRASSFSWDRCAVETVDVLKCALEKYRRAAGCLSRTD